MAKQPRPPSDAESSGNGPPSVGEEVTAVNPVARVAAFALLNRVQWVMTLVAAMVLSTAGLLLTVAWQVGPQVLQRHVQYAKLTARADAQIVESWLALNVDLAGLRNADFWRASAMATPCAVVDLQGDWGSDRRRAFCGTRLRFNESYDVTFLRTMAPGVPFAWSRDARGFAVPEIRVAPEVHKWLASHPVDTFMHRKWPASNALDWLKLELDQPVDAAIAGWTSPAATKIAIVYDPAHTDVLMPAGLVASRLARKPSWFTAIVIGAIGLAMWFAGMRLLPAMQNFNAPGRIVFSILPLLTIPWWFDYFPSTIRVLSAPLASVVGDMFYDIDILDRFAATAPVDALLAHGDRIVFRAGDGPYADTFGRLRFKPPATTPANADVALALLAQQANDDVRAFDDGKRVTFFTALARDKKLDLRAAGIVALPAAREALIDAGTEPHVRRAARAFLEEWTTSPTEEADPHLPAYHARIALTQSLADVPVPEIANMVRSHAAAN